MHNNAPNESPFGLSTVLIDKIFKMIKYTKKKTNSYSEKSKQLRNIGFKQNKMKNGNSLNTTH